MTANHAVLAYASRHREQLLYGIYCMGRNSIERGSRDTWTTGAWDLERVRNAMARNSARDTTRTSNRGPGYERTIKYFEMLHEPAARDPRGYIMPADQACRENRAGFPTARAGHVRTARRLAV